VPDLSAVVVRHGYDVKDISALDKFLPTPRRKTGTVTLHTPDSFVEYVKTFGDANTLLTADLSETRLDAILDYHEAGTGTPRWGQHRASYVCRTTDEWDTWTEIDGSEHAMSQEKFARFIEDNLPDIASPTGAELLELVKQLEVRNDVRWTGKVNLVDGARQLFYEEKIEGAGKGDLKIPETFTLGIAPFEGVAPYELTARLRYRVVNGNLLMWVDLHRPHKVVDDAFAGIVGNVEVALADMRLVHGKVG
jgi:uncharacterized protein YfdQ (DUF2303 family)